MKKGQGKKVKRARGRPRVITADVIKRVATLIGKGMTHEYACALTGISNKSLETARSRNPDFEGAIKKGQAVWMEKALDLLWARVDNWQPIAWLLERRHKALFSKTDTAVVAHTNASAALSEADFEEIGRLARKMFVQPQQPNQN